MAEWTIGVQGKLAGVPVTVGVYDGKIVGDPVAVGLMEALINQGQAVRASAALPSVVPSTDPIPFYCTAVWLLDDVEVVAGEERLADLRLPDDLIV